jgi:hypothetical protein
MKIALTDQETKWLENVIGNTVSDLFAVHWPDINRALNDANGELAVSFGVKVNCQGTPTVKTRISFATRFVDERESIMADQNQATLPLQQ